MNRLLVHLYTALAAMFARRARRRNERRRTDAVTDLYRAYHRETWSRRRTRCF